MDPLERTILQTEMSKFATDARKDLEAQTLIIAAQTAYKKREWVKAKELFVKAKSVFTPDIPITQLLCDGGFAISRAQARRYIRGGIVNVDGVRLRHDNIAVRKDQHVTFKGKSVQDPAKP